MNFELGDREQKYREYQKILKVTLGDTDFNISNLEPWLNLIQVRAVIGPEIHNRCHVSTTLKAPG